MIGVNGWRAAPTAHEREHDHRGRQQSSGRPTVPVEVTRQRGIEEYTK